MHNITVAFRNLGHHTIMIGAMTADAGSMTPAPSVLMSSFEIEALTMDKAGLRIAKSTQPPVVEYGGADKLSLCDMASTENWRRFTPFKDTACGGSIALLDSLYLPGEDSNKINRKLVLAIFESHKNPLNINDHAIFHGTMVFDKQESSVFSLERDNNQEKSAALRGEGLLGMLRKLVFVNNEGVEHKIAFDMPKTSRELHAQAYQDIIDNGSVSDATKERLREAGMGVYNYDSDYIDYTQRLARKTSLVAEKNKRLLTLSEQNQLDAASRQILEELMK